MVKQHCPICLTAVGHNPRYPRYVCEACGSKASSEDGRRVEFSNESLSGGYIAQYADTGADYPFHECFIDGVKCHADEARFGGIVIEAVSEPRVIFEILGQAKLLAQEYRRLTGKPLGITGEVAEYEAARILGVKLSPARQAGYDAVELRDGQERCLQIKGRCILDNGRRSQQLGSIRTDKYWDSVLMVLLDQNFDALEIFEAERDAIIEVLKAPGSRARNERGSMAVSKFKAIGTLRWRR